MNPPYDGMLFTIRDHAIDTVYLLLEWEDEYVCRRLGSSSLKVPNHKLAKYDRDFIASTIQEGMWEPIGNLDNIADDIYNKV